MIHLRPLRPLLYLFIFTLAACVAPAPESGQPTSMPAASGATTVDVAPIIDYRERFVPVVAQHGMVVGPERLAAEVGADMLRQGGNAVDAAVATAFALAVTYPRAGNLGGGGFMLIHLADEQRQTLVDYRETAPAHAHRDLFLSSVAGSRFEEIDLPGLVVGDTLTLIMILRASANAADVGGVTASSADLGNSARLFLDVTSGNAEFAAASGHDYTTVPEPGAALLGLVGAGVLTGARRRARG